MPNGPFILDVTIRWDAVSYKKLVSRDKQTFECSISKKSGGTGPTYRFVLAHATKPLPRFLSGEKATIAAELRKTIIREYDFDPGELERATISSVTAKYTET